MRVRVEGLGHVSCPRASSERQEMSALYPQVHGHAHIIGSWGHGGGGGAAKEGATPRLFQMLMFRSVHNKNILEWNSL